MSRQRPLWGRLPDPAGRHAEPFARFWAAYPARPSNPRAPAAKAFAALISRGVEPEALVAAATRYAQEVRTLGVAPAYIPHARTWLSQERWRDYLADPAVPEAAAPPEADPTAGHPLAALAAEVGLPAWRSWIAPLRVTVDGDQVRITAPSRFHAARVERDYATALGRLYPGRRLAWRAGR